VHEYGDGDILKGGHADWLCENAEFQFSKKYSALDPDKAITMTAITMTARQYASWNGSFKFESIAEYIVPFDATLKILEKEVERGKVGYFRKDSQANRVYYIHDKAVTLCGEAGGSAAKMGQYLFGCITPNYFQYDASGKGYKSQDQRAYYLNGKHGALPSHGGESKCKILFGCITPDRIEKRQNGQRFNEGTKFYTLTAQDQHGILIEGYIRKLTPIECERLQTLDDNYTAGISNSQRYKTLGNGWTVDVISHIFKQILQ
jgi:site-specific DNA-cytosine methylase